MSDFATCHISDYIRGMNINIAALSRQVKIPDGILRRSIVSRERPLRADAVLELCFCLGKEPMELRQEDAADRKGCALQ